MNNKSVHLETIHPKTRWRFIKDDIELNIINGKLKSADKVPSIAELANTYDVSKTTAQKALEDLYTDGIITKRKGVGYFVIPYSREKLKNKHFENLTIMLNNCFVYANKISIDDTEFEQLKKTMFDYIASYTHGE